MATAPYRVYSAQGVGRLGGNFTKGFIMQPRSKFDSVERALLEQWADSFGVPAVLNELGAICAVWSHRASENDNEKVEVFYQNCSSSIQNLAKHIATEIQHLPQSTPRS